jgi:periplasmic protein TonB
MAASKAPDHANKKRRRIIGFLLGVVILSGVVSLIMRTGTKKAEKEDFVIVDLAPPPPPPPPPPPEEEKPPEPEEPMEPAEISEADTPDDIAEDQGEQIDLGIDAGDLSSGPGSGGFLINLGRGGRGSGGGGGGGLLDDVDAPPTPVSKIQPSYPSSLLKSGVGGRVLISCVVDETGKVVSASVKQSAHPDLDKAALAAVNKWKFKPANKAGRNVTAKCVVPFNFEVKKS